MSVEDNYSSVDDTVLRYPKHLHDTIYYVGISAFQISTFKYDTTYVDTVVLIRSDQDSITFRFHDIIILDEEDMHDSVFYFNEYFVFKIDKNAYKREYINTEVSIVTSFTFSNDSLHIHHTDLANFTKMNSQIVFNGQILLNK